MTEQELETIEARANTASAGPWSRAEFIDHAHKDISALLAEVRRLGRIIFAHHAAGERIAGERCEFCPPGFWHEEKKEAKP